MSPYILHIYGPLYIHSYGLCIVIGLLTYILLTRSLLVPQFTDTDQYLSLLSTGICAGVVGGRALYIMTNYHEFHGNILEIFYLWQGGFSILGSIIAVTISGLYFMKKHSLPMAMVLDRIAVFGPLLQAISRVGCFLSGCCWGIPTTKFYGYTYRGSHFTCPTNISLHPTQLYSSVLLLIIFAILLFYFHQKKRYAGDVALLYFFLVACNRFCIDFLRGERSFFTGPSSLNVLSINQWIALSIMLASALTFCLMRLLYNYESIYPHKKSHIHS